MREQILSAAARVQLIALEQRAYPRRSGFPVLPEGMQELIDQRLAAKIATHIVLTDLGREVLGRVA